MLTTRVTKENKCLYLMKCQIFGVLCNRKSLLHQTESDWTWTNRAEFASRCAAWPTIHSSSLLHKTAIGNFPLAKLARQFWVVNFDKSSFTFLCINKSHLICPFNIRSPSKHSQPVHTLICNEIHSFRQLVPKLKARQVSSFVIRVVSK